MIGVNRLSNFQPEYMNDRGRQMSRTGARRRKPSLKAIQSAETEEKMDKMKNGTKENKKSKKGKLETEEKIEYKEKNSVDEWKSQPLNLDLKDNSILLDDGGSRRMTMKGIKVKLIKKMENVVFADLTKRI